MTSITPWYFLSPETGGWIPCNGAQAALILVRGLGQVRLGFGEYDQPEEIT